MRFFFFMLAMASATALAQGAATMSAPNISANALFLYQNSNFHDGDLNPASPDQQPNGFNIQEAELQFYSDVDPYARLNLLLSLHPEFKSDGTRISESWELEPEEAFLESLSLPSVTLKGGKFKAAMGKHNTLHSHAYPFIAAPLANVALLGDEGLNDVGVSAAALLPTPFFSEVTLQYLRGQSENEEFTSPRPSDGVGVLHWKNLVDLSDALTLEIGVSGASGGNSYRQTTSLYGGDLTFKWRPSSGGKYHSLMWATEYLGRTQQQSGQDDEKGGGLATWLQYQFAERWAGLYRYDNLTVNETFDATNLPNGTSERHSLALVFSPSEFSSFKLEYDQRHGGVLGPHGEDTEQAIFVQGNFTIGSHPAHSY